MGCAEWSERTAAGGAAVVGYLAVVAAGQRFALASQVRPPNLPLSPPLTPPPPPILQEKGLKSETVMH